MFKYILEKDTKELAPLLEAAFCPYLLSFPGLCNMLLDLISRRRIGDNQSQIEPQYITSLIRFGGQRRENISENNMTNNKACAKSLVCTQEGVPT